MNFIPGLELSRLFFEEAVRPLLAEAPPYAAALVGPGSEVLGFDTAMSTDHDWGPRVQLFFEDKDLECHGERLFDLLAESLPSQFRAFPTDVVPSAGRSESVVSSKVKGVEITTPRRFFSAYLELDIDEPMSAADWLSLPEQKLLSVTSGAVFHDEIGLSRIRERVAYYPHDVWLYQMAAVWERIGEEEHLVGRAGQVGDELGASIIASRLIRDLMRLCFLMERTYAPYPKWFGTAFSRLSSAEELKPMLENVIAATDWGTRDRALIPAYRFVAERHNRLGMTSELPSEPAPFFDRPFHVIHLNGQFSTALMTGIEDVEVRRLARNRIIGGIDLISDSTALLAGHGRRLAVKSLYE